MANAFTQNGALPEATDFAALSMNRYISGLITQASALSDAAVPYLQEKFYSAARYDRLIDGLNIEISSRMTPVRPPGSSVFNNGVFPGALSFYGWKSLYNGSEVIRTLHDGTDGAIYDATPGQKSTVFTKTAGAGATRFLGLATGSLYFGDGVEQKKWIRPGAWQATKAISPGTLINQGATPGVVYMALGGIQLPIIATAVQHSGFIRTHFLYIDPLYIPRNFPNLVGANLTFSGLTTDTILNGLTLQVNSIISTTLGILTVQDIGSSTQAKTADTGSGTTGTGTTGGIVPVFTATPFAVTVDSGQQWKSYGPAVENMGLDAPTVAPSFDFFAGGGPFDTRFWLPNATLSFGYSILDASGNIQMAATTINGASTYVTGLSYPTWNPANQFLAPTIDGTIVWYNMGKPGTWQPNAVDAGLAMPGLCVLDSNQNLQWISNGVGGMSGGVEPVWGNTFGATTADGALTWTCLGNGTVFTTAALKYAYSFHGVDGTVSTASIPAIIFGGIIGRGTGVNGLIPWFYVKAALATGIIPDGQTDQIWIWRTAQGQSTLILEDQIPVDGLTTSFQYGELGIPDTSATGGGALNAFIAAPTASSANPPQTGFLPMAYAFKRIWGALGNQVYYSAGPDATTGNGNTQFPPLNFIPFLGKVYAIVPVTVQNGGLIVYTSSGIQIILGTGTQSNPFYATSYYPSVNVVNFNAISLFNTTMFVMEATGKVSAISVEYPFNPSTGYVEIGQPIGDQFKKVTTGGISSALYNPATAFVAWNSQETSENALYVADGAVGWFRMDFLSYPETGAIWSPRRAIAGGTSAVQSIETSPGVTQLLIGPPAGTPGPILVRDANTNADNGANFPAPYATIGGLVVATPGEVAEIAFVTLDSVKVGTAPTIAMLFGEIAATTNAPFKPYTSNTTDPPLVKRTPQTLFAQRFEMLQGKQTPKCRYLQMKIQWIAENAPSELLAHAIYGAKMSERRQQP